MSLQAPTSLSAACPWTWFVGASNASNLQCSYSPLLPAVDWSACKVSYCSSTCCNIEGNACRDLSASRTMPESIRHLIFRQTRLPGQLPKALRGFKARFPHGGRGVEEYLRRQPYTEWKSVFADKVCHALQQMMRVHTLMVDQHSLVICTLHSLHQGQH